MMSTGWFLNQDTLKARTEEKETDRKRNLKVKRIAWEDNRLEDGKRPFRRLTDPLEALLNLLLVKRVVTSGHAALMASAAILRGFET
jgi:hypothetical protein